jgi:hypothetical protein
LKKGHGRHSDTSDDNTKLRARGSYPDRRLWTQVRPEHHQVPDKRYYYSREPGSWKEELQKWLRKRREEHKREQLDDNYGRRIPRPHPYLGCASNFHSQIVPLNVGQAGNASFTVWNDGNFPAWTCYVELYEGPTGYDNPLSNYEIRGRRIITLQPGERRDIILPWVRMRRTGRIVGICYDPLLDPKNFILVEQYNRHITSVHYNNLDGGPPEGPEEM